MAAVDVQRRWRERLRRRAAERAAQRRSAVTLLQHAARGRLARRHAKCLICLEEMPFASLVSTVPDSRCHRICGGCAHSYVDNAIREGKMYIRCPGEGCSHLMQPEPFASRAALAMYRVNMRASHQNRFAGESDAAFVGFCREQTRMCPACGVVIWRYAGCNHMTCRCGNEFDWTAQSARVVALPSSPTGTSQPPSSVHQMVRSFERLPGNATCFDCGGASARWVSLSFGTTLCLECAGAHRNLGVEKSFVRSLALDTLSYADAATLVRSGGNSAFSRFMRSREASPAWVALSIAERYDTRAAGEYRRRLHALRVEMTDDEAAAGDGAGEGAGEGASASERDGGRGGERGGGGSEVDALARRPRVLDNVLPILASAGDGQRARAELWSGNATNAGNARNAWRLADLPGPAAEEASPASARDIDDARHARILEGMERLLLMGFGMQAAREALDRHGGNVQRAALTLVGG